MSWRTKQLKQHVTFGIKLISLCLQTPEILALVVDSQL